MWRIPLYWLGLVDLAVAFESDNYRYFRIIYHDGEGGHFVRDVRSYRNTWRRLTTGGAFENRPEGYLKSWRQYPHHSPKFSWRKQSKVDRVKDRLLGVDNALSF